MRDSKSLPGPLLTLLAVATGAAAATIYLAQPLLQELGQGFGLPSSRIGMLATLTQLGYATGLCFLIPLGDILPKKKIILAKLVLLTLALILVALAPGFAVLMTGSLLIGIFATAAQDIVPLTAEIAPERSRGSAIGTVMSGLLAGILLSRTVSGAVAGLWGWRAVFSIAAGVIAITALTALLWIPATAPTQSSNYPELLKSLINQWRKHPLLRRSLRTHGLVGFAFSAFWTNLAFHLGSPEFGFSTTQIGLFGLAGVAGVLAAPLAGRLSDRRGPRTGIRIGVFAVALAFAVMFFFPSSIATLILGAVLFDLGAQMSLVSHQMIVYALDPAARSSLNAVFMTGMFMAFSVGSAVSVQIQYRAGWSGVLALCVAAGALANASAWLMGPVTEDRK